MRSKIQNENPDVLVEHIKVKSHADTIICIGIYEAVMPAPNITFSVKPNLGKLLRSSLERRDSRGDYTLLYRFKNLSAKPCEIIVRTAENSVYSYMASH